MPLDEFILIYLIILPICFIAFSLIITFFTMLGLYGATVGTWYYIDSRKEPYMLATGQYFEFFNAFFIELNVLVLLAIGIFTYNSIYFYSSMVLYTMLGVYILVQFLRNLVTFLKQQTIRTRGKV